MKQKNPTKSINLGPKGFTLLEILIAMSIIVLILSTLYTAYTGTFRIIRETESGTEIYEMARIVLERMVEDLESVYISHWRKVSENEEDTQESIPFVGEDAEIDGRSADTLRFYSKAHIVFNEQDKDAGTAHIVYEIKESLDGDSFFLYRSDTAELEEGSKEGTGGLILCDGLHSVNFTYYDDNGEAYDRWDSTSELFKEKLPARVSILLEFVNSSDPEAPFKFMTGVVLPLARNTYGKVS
ncbi:MAG: type II secretion system protein [Desulfatiglandales bacterium]